MAHTPGPFVAWDDGRTIGIETEHGPIAVAEIVDHGGMADEAQLRADHVLLAAAPDMLAALKEAEEELRRCGLDCVDSDARSPALLAKLATAIAKAEGRE